MKPVEAARYVTTTIAVLAHMQSAEDVRCWLLDLASRRVKPRSWGFYRTDAATWPARRPDVNSQVEAARTVRDRREAADARQFAELMDAEGAEAAPPVIPPPRPILIPTRCGECSGTGIRPQADDPALWEWCQCPAGERTQAEHPAAVEIANERVFRVRQRCSPPDEKAEAPAIPSGARQRGSARVDRKGLMRAGDVVPILPALLAARKA